MDDITNQKVEWRGRLAGDVLSNMHDDETRRAILHAGLEQAYAEGVEDAATICDGIAHQAPDEKTKRVAIVTAKALRDYNARNRADRG